jgi:hypothetical protein
MDGYQFDLLTKTVGGGSTRRGTLRVLAGVAGGGLTVLLGVPQHEAGEAERRRRSGQKDRKQKRKRETKHKRQRGRKQSQHPHSPPTPSPTPGPCSDGMKLCDGSCIPAGNCCTDTDCSGAQVCRAGACAAPTLYPNLRTLPVSDLYFDQHPADQATVILRFANTVWNAGEGRLELESDLDSTDMPKPIYQNLYDAPTGGNRTERKRVASDFIFHPQHNHFHFADFAEYLLLGQDATGAYRPMKTEGIKTSFCIMDTRRIDGDHPDQYKTCSTDRQGLSPGWADSYGSSLYDQWIVLGDQPLSDGEYAVQSIADPRGLLDEGGGAREADNTAITYFKVEGGAIRNVRDQP